MKVHYYFGENTFDAYRLKTLEMKAGWINELLESGRTDMPNSEAPDIEEMLDMLSDSPEEAENRRKAREEKAREHSLKRRADGLFAVLRTMTEIAAGKNRARKKYEKTLQTISNNFNLQRMWMESREKRRLEEAKKLKLSANALERLSAIELRSGLERTRASLKAKRDACLADISELTRKYNRSGGDLAERRKIALELKRVQAERDQLNEELIRSASAVQKMLTPQVQGLSDPGFDENWREKLNAERDSSEKEALEELTLSEEKEARYLSQNTGYLKEMHSAGMLPFDLSVLDRLGSFVLTPDNLFVFAGARYLQKRESGGFTGLEVLEVFPEEKTAKAAVFNPFAGKKNKAFQSRIYSRADGAQI